MLNNLESDIKNYILEKIKPLKIKYKFVDHAPGELYGICLHIESQTLFISCKELAYSANYFNALYKVHWKDFIQHVLSHELKHFEVSQELLKLNVPLSRQRLAEYVICQELYISKILPDPYYIKETARLNIFNNLLTEQKRIEYNRRVLRSPMDATVLVLFLSDDEIKAFFEPPALHILLLLKSVYNDVNSIPDIKIIAETLIRKIRKTDTLLPSIASIIGAGIIIYSFHKLKK
jgi:hypothetical protein